ncbi:sodium:solute symporter family transporter [Rhodopirellula sp. MGV]|uniref:sodium:solute symporter family transporter n=1 Tax=Rhodopirellula sp. MGV TaxID=2023130 RepID=UPI000B979D53|nr:hypothetical protein [Rhodopirellula sp. MGV]OYP36386.1 hypothetical protein CGZ80_08745 [Rhodopirellula sp. MGV]PNY38380.1 hypothetical protein C2E31_00030 [Rhodopirellula baltica]
MNSGSNAALYTFCFYTVAVFVLAIVSERFSKGKEFVGEYFLGSRGFGVWAFALTFAATNASGGSFMGFPALIYTHGWTLAFWIAGFMMVPLMSMGLIGKRINQVARKSNAVTIPEILGARYASPRVTLVATGLLVFFMFFYLLAQFKAGGKILSTLLADEPRFQWLAATMTQWTHSVPWLNQASGDYLVCLLLFSTAVIVYVVYGGFRAVVWTDVMQGIVMFVGVIGMLALALHQSGGLRNVTTKMAQMTPPEFCRIVVSQSGSSAGVLLVPKGTWIKNSEEVFRTAEAVELDHQTRSAPISAIRLTTEHEIEQIEADPIARGVDVEVVEIVPYRFGAREKGVYVSNPGPSANSDLGFLAVGTAISFFVFWPFGATGQPANMVRLMAFKDSRTLRVSIVTVSVYYAVIYLSLIIIFCCARVLMPGMEIDPDRTMPDLATQLTTSAGVPWLAGLLVAAPFAAVMSSVDSFLLVVSSSVVRDIYQKQISPDAPEKTLKRLSRLVTIGIGLFAVVLVVNPPMFLQDLIVFASGGLAACFLVPIVLSLYWKPMTAAGSIAGMLGGTLMHVALTAWGYLLHSEFRPFELFGLNPFLWDLVTSLVAAVTFSRWSGQSETSPSGLRMPK